MVRVLLAVAHASLRAALEECLAPVEEMSCGAGGTGEELWDRLARERWDVVILDLRLSQQTQLETVQRLHESYPKQPILVISLGLGISSGRWRKAGARGFLAKGDLSGKLIEAVRIISQGGEYFPDEDERRG